MLYILLLQTIVLPIFFKSVKMKLYQIVSLLLIGMFSFFSLSAQENDPKAFVKISREVTKPLTLYKQDLIKMKQSTALLKDRDCKTHEYARAALQQILEMAGVTVGKQLHGEKMSKYLLVKCADGYEVIFSLAELDSSFTDRIVILADESEGKPLAAAKGPFRLVVPGEKRPARSGLQVVEFLVRFAKEYKELRALFKNLNNFNKYYFSLKSRMKIDWYI